MKTETVLVRGQLILKDIEEAGQTSPGSSKNNL